MALSEEDKQEILQFLKEEEEQKRKKALSSGENFRNYLQAVHNIVLIVSEVIKLLQFLKPFF
ncbi:hypothetical protein NG791_09780 [Laspinema sp. D1]|uniref:hypothetical protein n=1 Tax=Laspinema palackyanum TaxID=3231601 RepID=UPI003471DC53|nr:hypothetical protein [Laspinema sp. D2b]